jgi:prepilin-type processing-associated H-X9-DG protein/prepilin-type N-terminal cleavage/methylation domain-containing protein
MRKATAFTLIELLVAVAVIGVLSAVTMGAMGRARSQAQSVECVSNLRQWGVALRLYMNDNANYMPRRGQGVQPVWEINRPTDWFNALPPYLGLPSLYNQVLQGQQPKPGDHSVFVCPSAASSSNGQYFLCYGMNMFISRWDQPQQAKVTQLPDTEFLAFMADSPGGYASTMPSSAQYSVEPRHNGYANVAFVDGHVASFSGTYLGCGSAEIEQSDVHWRSGLPGDVWAPN